MPLEDYLLGLCFFTKSTLIKGQGREVLISSMKRPLSVQEVDQRSRGRFFYGVETAQLKRQTEMVDGEN